MPNIDYHNMLFPLDLTLCKDCAYRLSRRMVPLDEEDLERFGFDNTIENDDDYDETIIEQHICLATKQDMNYMVVECNYFTEKTNGSLFRTNPY